MIDLSTIVLYAYMYHVNDLKALRHPIAGRWHPSLEDIVRNLRPSGYDKMKHLNLRYGDGLAIRMVKPEGEIL